MSITAHMIVENEENFVYFSVLSVIDHVEKIMIYDSGSVDGTPAILKSIKERFPQKIDLTFGEKLTSLGVAQKRSKMLNQTKTEWMFVLDGDEVWWESAIKELRGLCETVDKKYNGIITNYSVPCGDIFHKYPGKGGYVIGKYKGDITIRAMRTKCLSGVSGTFPLEGYVLKSGQLIQNVPENLYYHQGVSYLHTSFLKRTSVHNNKVKREFGDEYPLDFKYPEVFFERRPDFAPSPWNTVDSSIVWEYLLRGVSRKILNTLTKLK
jgi:glycosyltransferase involved in cell wall biosynthesis